MSTHLSQASREGYRLSQQQKRLWPVVKLAGASKALLALAIEGSLEPAMLRAAVLKVVEAHESFRAIYIERAETGEVIQIICEPEIDWRHVQAGRASDEGDAREGLIDDICRREQARPFDLGAMPQLRGTLLEFGTTRHLLVLTTSMLAADARSLDNLSAHLSTAYGSLRSSGSVCQPSPPLQYLQYAEWQNELLSGEEGAADRRYWQGAMRVPSGDMILPFEKRRPGDRGLSGDNFVGESVRACLQADLCAEIRRTCRAHGVPLHVFLLAVWHSLLHRLTHEATTKVSILYDGREYEELAGCIGLVWNWLPTFGDFDPGTTILKTAAQLREGWENAEAHTCWFDEDKDETPAGARATKGVGFGFESGDDGNGVCRSDGLTFRRLRRQSFVAQFKLMLWCTEQSGGELVSDFQFDASRFERHDVEHFAEAYRRLLEAALREPDARLGRLPLVGESEMTRIISLGDGGGPEVARDLRVEQLFESVARQKPNATAVVFEEQRLTYAELDDAAEVLAGQLVALGAGPDVTVGLCLPRTPDLIVGILGILKSGGAYVPIEPSFPDARTALMLADSRAAIVVTDGALRERFSDFSGKVVTVCEGREANRLSRPRLNGRGWGHSLAYLIYTSGSTGRPKGVAVEHRQLAHYVGALTGRHPSLAGRSFASVSTVAADLGNTAIYTALLTGGTLHLISQECATDAQRFVRYLEAHEVEALKIVPSHLSALMHSTSLESVLPKSCLVLGGEPLFCGLVEQIAAATPASFIMLNHYGPTEATVGATTFQIAAGGSDDATQTPIGRPLPTTRVYLLDEQMQPVPAGVKGELFIGGGGVARGYYGQPELTARRFVPNPFATEPGQRLYRTGDVARFRHDGSLVFEGRRDHQVKIRGFRVELGEVEAALKSHPAVRDAVVLACAGEQGETTLAAYVVLNNAAGENVEAVQAYLSERLPSYMIPSALRELDALPLSPNGKVNRVALQAAGGVAPRHLKEHEEPRTETEREVHAIWIGLLQNPSIGINDGFFDVGGSSLKAIQLLSRLRQAFDVELPLATIFDRTSVAALAAFIDESRGQPEGDEGLGRMLRELEQLSDDQVRQRLADYRQDNPEPSPDV